jgi:metallo-beta-lactamase class B
MRAIFLFVLVAGGLLAQQREIWNVPQEPFRIYGDTYFVGTHGLTSILITSKSGHVLIDGALPESVPQIVEHIKKLGFRIEDIKLILNTHAHFDHAGGIAQLQRLSRARVAASPWAAEVMRKGEVLRNDPQFGIISPVDRVSTVDVLKDRETLKAGDVSVMAHFTPGHTPGGTSWTWQSCEGSRCLNLVYSDSLTPVSADGFFFTHRKEFPKGEDFERSISFLEKTPCDILLTPHPDFSQLWQRLERRNSNPDAFVDTGACRALAASSREALEKRLGTEAVGSK